MLGRGHGSLAGIAAVFAVAVVALGLASPAGATVPTPTVTPATGGGGKPVVSGFTKFDLADVGYEQSEFFLSGTATAYDVAESPGNDGKLAATPSTTAPYTTRVVVVRPIKAKDFNGTVVVEWLNVSGGADAGPDWMLAHNQLIRDGAVWVGVSAQKVGVEALKGTDPVRGDAARYAGLSHPGDDYSYDIYSQAGQALRDDAATMFSGLKPRHFIAVGESQSAMRLVTYIDAVHPLAHVYDGYLVHSRAGGAPIRDDVGVPVLVFMTETDVNFSNGTVRQPDTSTYRLWEVPGTAHFDQYGLSIGPQDTGDGQGAVAVLESMQHPTNQPGGNFTCGAPINTGPAHFVLDAAFHHLEQWVADGTPPPKAPRMQTTSTAPLTFATDQHGNTLGGIRTPALDAPVATLTGKSPGGSAFCFLFGTTTPFTAEQMQTLYPTHRAFVAAFTRSTNAARRAGFLVDADAKELVRAAKQSDIGAAPSGVG
jgi:Alpha/beta hydrolase domain